VLPRAIPMVEAMVALTLVDHLMMQVAQCELFPKAEGEQPNPLGKTARRDGDVQRHQVQVAATGPVSRLVDEE
jgi:chorismate synthase